MDLHLNIKLASGYKSNSQIARLITESWFTKNMYCPACPSDELKPMPANEKVIDFICPACKSSFQLKALSHKFSQKVADGAYTPKIQMIKNGTAPNWFFMQYDKIDWLVKKLIIIPSHFMVPNAIEERAPLKQTARRAGWVGSNILLNRLPPDARLFVIIDGQEIPKNTVRKNWKQFEFFKNQKLEAKGWLSDVLACVRELDKKEFTLQEMYDFVPKLEGLHPGNKHVPDKIRQQLQVLRDNDVLNFISPGKYKLKV